MPSRVTWMTRQASANGWQRGEWGQVLRHELAARGISIAVRFNPTTTLDEQIARGGIDRGAPGGEEAHVPPVQDVGAGLGARFKDDRLLALGQEVCRGGEADWPGADDRDRKRSINIERDWHGFTLSHCGSQ